MDRPQSSGEDACCGCVMIILGLITLIACLNWAQNRTEAVVYFVVDTENPKICGGAFINYDLALTEAYFKGTQYAQYNPWIVKPVERSKWKESHYLCMRKYHLTPPTYSL